MKLIIALGGTGNKYIKEFVENMKKEESVIITLDKKEEL